MNKLQNTYPSIDSTLCPCCLKIIVDKWDICDICGWENDPLQATKPDLKGGANTMSLNEAKKAFQESKPVY